MGLAISWQDIEAAAQRLHGVAHRTPVVTSRHVNQLTGAQVFFKCENLQRVGAFKFRGAYNTLSQLPAEQRRRGVIAWSSGNHGQAVALAAQLLGMPAVIVMPKDAPAIKLAATRDYGAEVVQYDRYTEDREQIGRSIAAERGLALVPPFDHPHVMAGQGTAIKELIEETGPLDLLFVGIGGGGLISGSATAAHHLSPGCEVWGVEPEAGNDVQQSLQRGERVTIGVPQTIADAAQTSQVGELTFPVIQQLVKGVLTVSDAQLVRAMRLFAERLKLVVEPTGCLGTAALLHGLRPVQGRRVGVMVSGGNVDLARYGQWLQAA
jgi:threonine dehydratase